MMGTRPREAAAFAVYADTRRRCVHITMSKYRRVKEGHHRARGPAIAERRDWSTRTSQIGVLTDWVSEWRLQGDGDAGDDALRHPSWTRPGSTRWQGRTLVGRTDVLLERRGARFEGHRAEFFEVGQGFGVDRRRADSPCAQWSSRRSPAVGGSVGCWKHWPTLGCSGWCASEISTRW